MKLIMLPNTITKEEFTKVQKVLDEIENNPETENDYCLVDVFEHEINVKVFIGEKVDKKCQEIGCTPRDFLMAMMCHQNGVEE